MWHDNGQRAMEGRYVAGKPEGTWTFWDQTGRMIKEEVYAEGKKVR